MKKLSGSSGRSLLLLITNIALMFFGAITVASGSILIGIFLLHLFTFTSQLFLVVPVVLITSGTLTIIVAIFGLSLFKRKNEKSGVFLAYASIILVALLISLTASVTSFVLRESIAHRFSKTDVADQLQGYATDPFIRSRWDSIQREFRCCGGYNVGTGYTDWEGVSVEPLPIGASPAALVTGNDRSFVPTLSRVPDSCCIRERPGCGKTAFENDNNPSASISEKIHVNGCMTEARQTLFKHVMPLLLICALVSLVVGLIELLLLLCAVCFADHIKRLSSLDGSSSIGRSSSLSQEKQGIIQDTGEAYLSHEEKQLEYGLDNANPGYYNGEELIGNEDDSVSWYDSSTTDTRIRHQLPLLDGSPSLRKNRFFPFQGSQPSLNNGYELQNNQDPEAGPDSLQGNKNGAEEPIKSQESRSQDPVPPAGLFGIFSIFSRLFDRKKSGVGQRQKHLNLREDALDREATLMNVLKSVTTNKSEPDLIEASKESKSSGGFNFFGMRSKSKENVLETTDGGAEGGKKDETEVKKLPTLDDKTIDKNKKFAPMENLTDAGKPKRGGLARLKRIRDEMFGKKHQTLKEEDVKEPTEIEDKPDSEEKKDGENEDKKDGDLNFDEQKKKEDEDNGSSESSTETSSSSSESSDKSDEKVESRKSSKTETTAAESGSKVERKPSNRSVHYEEDIKPQFKSGTPVRGSTFQRSISNENPPMTGDETMRSISPSGQQRVRVSGFGVTPQTNPRHTRTLSMTTSPKLNTIHEPVHHHHPRVRTRSMHVTGTIPIDAVDDEIVQYAGMARKSSRSPGPYNRSMSPQTNAYYLQQQQNNNRLARMQSLARSEEHLNKAPVFVEYLRPVGILTQSGSPPPAPRPGSALGHSRDNSQEGHVTKIKIEDNAENDDDDRRGREDSRSSRKKKDSSRSRDRSDSRKKSKSRSDKKKKKKSSKRRSSRSSSGRSDSSDSYSDSGSEDSSEDSESVSESDSDKKSRKKSRRSSRKDDKKRKESKSKHRKKSKRHRSGDSSPEKKHRKKSSDKSSSDKKKSKVVESSTSPTRESNSQRQPHQAYDNHDYMNMQQRNPYDNQGGFVVEAAPAAAAAQNHGYYSTATLPSSASLRKTSGGYQVVPIQGPPGVRAISEPRTAKKLVAATSTLDRYTLMAANAARSKSADRVPMKYRRVSLDPGSTGAYQLHQGYPGQQPQSKVRSVSLATHEAGDIHVYNNAQMYRTTVEMEPHSGEMYAMQGGGRMAKTSRIRDDMILHRRPTHISEARLMIQGDGGEQISLPHGVVHQY